MSTEFHVTVADGLSLYVPGLGVRVWIGRVKDAANVAESVSGQHWTDGSRPCVAVETVGGDDRPLVVLSNGRLVVNRR